MATDTDDLIINTGPVSSFGSLTYHVAPRLADLRNALVHGYDPNVAFDLRGLSQGRMSISALTAFLSLAHRLRTFYGHPIPTLINWNPAIQSFWADVDFLKIVQQLSLLEINQGLLGGYKSGQTNKQTRILYFNEIPSPSDLSTKENMYAWKDACRQSVKERLSYFLFDLLRNIGIPLAKARNLEMVLGITTAELIVNALLHGRDLAFVGIQRSSRGVTVSVCDSGRGFLKSMRDNYLNQMPQSNEATHANAIAIASLMKREEIGLYRAISDVLGNYGWVVMSSFDCEIRWEPEFWLKVASRFDENRPFDHLVGLKLLGQPQDSRYGVKESYRGYYKQFKDSLVGTRVTFEIPV
ncbi:MAG: hypothetical protein M3R08_00625 [Bacteroidota bacterium]|nr:hypothetical protein [Bacteroidota bacterium]